MSKKNQISDENKKFYAKLLVFPKRRSLLGLLVVGYVIFFTSVINQESLLQKGWLEISIPLLLAGIILMAFPVTETWEYTPWQSESERHEQMFRND
jgi:hypothetical protein